MPTRLSEPSPATASKTSLVGLLVVEVDDAAFAREIAAGDLDDRLSRARCSLSADITPSGTGGLQFSSFSWRLRRRTVSRERSQLEKV